MQSLLHSFLSLACTEWQRKVISPAVRQGPLEGSIAYVFVNHAAVGFYACTISPVTRRVPLEGYCFIYCIGIVGGIDF